MTLGHLSNILLVFLIFSPVTTSAQGAPAREYLNIPVNQAAIFGDILGTNGETAADSDIPLPNNVTITRNVFLSSIWSFPQFDRYGGVAVSAGYAKVHVSGASGEVETWGFTDPSVTLIANVFGAPALSIEEFPKAIPQKNQCSVRLVVHAPLGSYDNNSAVNTGANRWAFTPIVNLDITPDKGVSWIDLYAGGRWVTNNNAFQGNNVLSQNPLGVVTAHYSHNIGKRMWAGIGVHYDNGGASSVNHISQHDYANNFRPAAIVNRRIGKFSFTLRYENTASKPNAAPTNWLLSIRVAGPVYPFL